MKKLYDILQISGIEYARALPLYACTVKKQYLLERLPFTAKTALMGLIPYYPEEYDAAEKKTVSVYAAAKDYHLFVKRLQENAAPEIEKAYPGFHFAFFTDRSPIDERDAAARAGLGIIGRNGLLINEKHSSFVFIFEIITDLETDFCGAEPEYCENCGLCGKACPAGGDMTLCLSSLTQKKGALTGDEQQQILKSGCAWGCDLCQEVCPHTKKAREAGTLYTDIPFFRENLIFTPDKDSISDEKDFGERAYSWRGADTILRNIKLLDNHGNHNKTIDMKGGNRE